MNRNIIEIFKSLQGEGIHIGTPSIFIRFSGCNLKCEFCDSKFSWNEKGTYSIEDAINYIKKNNNYTHIIFTGGCPLLYQKEIEEIILVIVYNRRNIIFTIETNTTIIPDNNLKDMMSFYHGTWSCSPKLISESTWKKEVIEYYNKLPNSYFKFVITSPIEQEIEKIISLVNKKIITKPFIIIQPDGNCKDYHEACRELADYIISHNLTNFRVLPQFHKICWNNERNK